MDITSLITVLLVLAIVGFICYLIVTYIPMPGVFKQVIIVVMVILLILYTLSFLHIGKAIHLG